LRFGADARRKLSLKLAPLANYPCLPKVDLGSVDGVEQLPLPMGKLYK
jgi:hypothetical protein